MRPGSALRQQIRAWLDGRRHWLLAVDVHQRPFVEAVFDRVNATIPAEAPRVPVHVAEFTLRTVDEDSGVERDLGPLWLVAIPRAALSPETLQALVQAHYDVEVPCTQLLRASFLTPMGRDALGAMGERLQVFSAWLKGDAEEVDDAS